MRHPILAYSSPLIVFLVPAALALSACTVPKVLGANPNETATDGDTSTSSGGLSEGGTSTTASPSTSSSPPTSTTGTGTTGEEITETTNATAPVTETTNATGGPVSCDNPAFTCTVPIDCEQWRCGELDSPFDAEGCLRASCDDQPCAADEVCYSVENECMVAVQECYDIDGICGCNIADGCFARHCVPADEGLPVTCPAITDADACIAAGCNEFQTVQTLEIVDDMCTCGEVRPLCMWFPGDTFGGDASPGAFYEIATGQVAMFNVDWIVPPHGWASCDDPGAPSACECFTFDPGPCP